MLSREQIIQVFKDARQDDIIERVTKACGWEIAVSLILNAMVMEWLEQNEQLDKILSDLGLYDDVLEEVLEMDGETK